MKRLLLDIDGVIADFTQAYIDSLFESTGIKRKCEEVTTWGVGDALGLSQEQRAMAWAALKMPGKAFFMKELPGAVEAVKLLSVHADIYFVTSPFNAPTWCYDRDQWLQLRFGPELGKRVTYTHDKHICTGDVFVDDKPENVRKWQAHNPGGVAVLWSRNVNKESDWPQRTNDWEDIRKLVMNGIKEGLNK